MIKNGMLYLDELKRAYYNIWYNDEYKYYFGTNWNGFVAPNEEWGDWEQRIFVSVDPEDESLIGVVRYSIDRAANNAEKFGAIDFYKNDMRKSMIFAKDMSQIVDDVFVRFNHHRMSWYVICGNPIEDSYDRLCKKLGGRIIGVSHESVIIDNVYHNEKQYEILQKQYLKHRSVLIKDIKEES